MKRTSTVKGLGQIEEIAQDLSAVLTHNAFGMKLHPVRRPIAVFDPHDQPVVALGADLEFSGRARSFDDERMIASGGEGSVQAAEETARIMQNARRLAMDRRRRA